MYIFFFSFFLSFFLSSPLSQPHSVHCCSSTHFCTAGFFLSIYARSPTRPSTTARSCRMNLSHLRALTVLRQLRPLLHPLPILVALTVFFSPRLPPRHPLHRPQHRPQHHPHHHPLQAHILGPVPAPLAGSHAKSLLMQVLKLLKIRLLCMRVH